MGKPGSAGFYKIIKIDAVYPPGLKSGQTTDFLKCIVFANS